MNNTLYKMEIPTVENMDASFYLDRIIMVPVGNGFQNSFYKVTKITNKLVYARKMKTETKLLNAYMDNENNIIHKFEAVIDDDFEDNCNQKIIKKEKINDYPIVYVPVVQYEISVNEIEI